MATHEEEPRSITNDPVEIRAVVESFYVMGALDDNDIYEIVKSDGTTAQLYLGGRLRPLADLIIQEVYPGCAAILLSSGEVTQE